MVDPAKSQAFAAEDKPRPQGFQPTNLAEEGRADFDMI